VDDAVAHCATWRQAAEVRAAIGRRLAGVGLQLHPAKTKIVYGKDSRRRGSGEHMSFTFLGSAFRPRRAAKRGSGLPHSCPMPAMALDLDEAQYQDG
jgi:hypothetical protein